jgi:arylsulfatase A-like enzyme
MHKPLLASLTSLALTAASSLAADRPNVLWITSEDNGPHLGAYGDPYATTPVLDALAARSLRYHFASSSAPVCAPARTTIITGMYPTSLGAEHMRSMVPLPEGHQLYPTILREAGYYCTNNSKTDYNVSEPTPTWDESSGQAHWRDRPDDSTPFFAIFNFTISHESQIRNAIPEERRIHDPAEAPVPPYHPDTPEVRKDWAQYYDRLTMMDEQAGELLAQLEEDGLAADTIIFYYGDHGSGMPRSKRWPYASGLRVPLLIHVPEKWRHLAPEGYEDGGVSHRPVSFVDLAPTLLSILGIEPPAYMQGQAFMGPHATPDEGHTLSFGFRGRMDERIDCVRSVTDGRFTYLRHFQPHLPYGQHIDYMFQTPTTRVWHQLFKEGKLDAIQAAFWQPKPAEELYDLEADPHETVNLATSPDHQVQLQTFRDALLKHMRDTRDTGLLPEAELHRRTAAGGFATPYDMAQDPVHFPFEMIFAAADRATRADEASAQDCGHLLDSADPAIRYWGAIGLLIRGQEAIASQLAPLRKALKDEAAAVRIAAAAALAQHSPEQEDFTAALDVLIADANLDADGGSLFAAIQAMNAIGQLGPRTAPARAAIEALPTKLPKGYSGRLSSYPERLHQDLLEAWD